MTREVDLPIEDQLRTALAEVAECISVGPLADIAEHDRAGRSRPTRVRALTAAGIAAVLAIGIATAVVVKSATNDGHSRHTTPANSTSTTNAPFVDDGPLTAPRFYRGGLITLLPPRDGARPNVTAAAAYAASIGFPRVPELPSPHLIVADATIYDYGLTHNDGTVTPLIDHRLAWVVTYTNVPTNAPIAGPHLGGVSLGPANTTTTTLPVDPTAPTGQTVLVFVDARTGDVLDLQGFPDSYSTSVPLECPTRSLAQVPAHQTAGTTSTFVPGDPLALIACRYHGLNQPQPAGSFAKSAHLTPGGIAQALNAQPAIPTNQIRNCPDDSGETILLIFGYPNGSRLRVSIDASGCRSATNGDFAIGMEPRTLEVLETALGRDDQHA